MNPLHLLWIIPLAVGFLVSKEVRIKKAILIFLSLLAILLCRVQGTI